VRDRLSFMRFLGLELHHPVPDATTIWLFREALVARSGSWRPVNPVDGDHHFQSMTTTCSGPWRPGQLDGGLA
jgi:hypothetical protein